MPYYIIGNGSNLLVSDAGYRGVIVQIYKEMNEVKVEGDLVKAQAGALLSGIAAKALGAELSGFEFASGIPGTIGGAWCDECRSLRRRDEGRAGICDSAYR